MKDKELNNVVDAVMNMIDVFDFSKPRKKYDRKKNIWLKKVTINKDYDINALKK